MINSGKSTPFNSIPLFFINKPSILSLLLSSPSFLLPCPSLSCLHHLSHLPPSLSLSFLPSLLSLSCSTPLSLVPLLPLFLPVLSVTLFLPSNRITRFFRTLSPFLCLSFFLPLSLSHNLLPVTVLVPSPCLPFHLPFLPLRTRSKFPSIRFAKGKKINKMGIGIKNKIFI